MSAERDQLVSEVEWVSVSEGVGECVKFRVGECVKEWVSGVKVHSWVSV